MNPRVGEGVWPRHYQPFEDEDRAINFGDVDRCSELLLVQTSVEPQDPPVLADSRDVRRHHPSEKLGAALPKLQFQLLLFQDL